MLSMFNFKSCQYWHRDRGIQSYKQFQFHLYRILQLHKVQGFAFQEMDTCIPEYILDSVFFQSIRKEKG